MKQGLSLTDVDVDQLIFQIGNQDIREINLSNNKLTLKSLKNLFKFVQRNKNVKMINVENNQLDQVNKDRISKEFEKKGVTLKV